jgi:hypothetical protein
MTATVAAVLGNAAAEAAALQAAPLPGRLDDYKKNQ